MFHHLYPKDFHVYILHTKGVDNHVLINLIYSAVIQKSKLTCLTQKLLEKLFLCHDLKFSP